MRCALLIGLCLTVVVSGLSCESSRTIEIAEPPPEPISPSVLDGRQTAQQYAGGQLTDYELVWKLHDLDPNDRPPFLHGFVEAFTQAGDPARGVAYRGLLEEAVSGPQFRTATELGTKHAARAVANEQVQGVIRSSLGVSPGVALGWKAGYIKGFAAQRVVETAAVASVNEATIAQLRREAAAMYHALRATVEQ